MLYSTPKPINIALIPAVPILIGKSNQPSKLNVQEIRVRGFPKQKTPPDGGVDTDGFNVTIRYLPGLKKPVAPFSVLVINNAVPFRV